ncbi:MAG: hypothetical protein ACJ748_07815 [Flavisolibacter sp.]
MDENIIFPSYRKMLRFSFLILLILISAHSFCQDNYEIQVYGSETVDKGSTMIELHSNYTFSGTRVIENSVYPSHHILHETIELTHGFSECFEIGFYLFNALGSNGRSGYVGSHIRPRIAVPDKWNWPVGVSLSIEGGYQKKEYSEDDWSMEIRPIIDKTFEKFYVSFNPTFDKSLHGLNSNKGYIFSPNLKGSFAISRWWNMGVEYYGSVGTLFHFDPYQVQQHALFVAADFNFSPDIEFNMGYGFGLTKSTDSNIFKIIMGYRLNKKVK